MIGTEHTYYTIKDLIRSRYGFVCNDILKKEFAASGISTTQCLRKHRHAYPIAPLAMQITNEKTMCRTDNRLEHSSTTRHDVL